MKRLKVLVIVAIIALLSVISNAELGSKDQEERSKDYLSLIAVEKSLLIKHLKEGVEHKEIFGTKHSDCEFSIVDQEPENHEFIKIDRETNMVTSTVLDREDEVFSRMLIPQIQVQLQLDCPNAFVHYGDNNVTMLRSLFTDTIDNNLPTRLGDRSYVLTRDINFAPQTMILSIIIEDVNDNHPHFVYPPTSNYLIGYPEAEVSEELLPDYLLKVNAIDKDEGLNAKIKYKITPNDHFDINPETGEIYPFENALFDTEQVNLTVYAADRNGAKDAQVSSFDLKIRKIGTEHLALLTIEKESAFEAEKTLEYVRHRTGINFKVLKKGFMLTRPNRSTSTEDGAKWFERTAKTVILRAWIYGFDSEEKLLESSIMETKVSEIGKEIRVTAVSHAKTKNKTNDRNITKDESETIIAFIIAIVFLLIIIIALIVTFISWYCCKLRKYKRMPSPSGSTATTISTISNDVEHQMSPVEVHHGNPFHNPVYHKRDSLKRTRDSVHHNSLSHNRNSILKGRSSLPETSELNRFAQKLHHILGDITELHGSTAELNEPKTPNERRKSSVTFNDNIQFFNISDDDDEESINNVRL